MTTEEDVWAKSITGNWGSEELAQMRDSTSGELIALYKPVLNVQILSSAVFEIFIRSEFVKAAEIARGLAETPGFKAEVAFKFGQEVSDILFEAELEHVNVLILSLFQKTIMN